MSFLYVSKVLRALPNKTQVHVRNLGIIDDPGWVIWIDALQRQAWNEWLLQLESMEDAI